MAEIPITLTCECGEQHSVQVGDTVNCGCGRVYDTRARTGTAEGVRHAQAKMRLYITFGILLLVAAAFATYVLWGREGSPWRSR